VPLIWEEEPPNKDKALVKKEEAISLIYALSENREDKL